jgi:hypothetical protein
MSDDISRQMKRRKHDDYEYWEAYAVGRGDIDSSLDIKINSEDRFCYHISIWNPDGHGEFGRGDWEEFTTSSEEEVLLNTVKIILQDK